MSFGWMVRAWHDFFRRRLGHECLNVNRHVEEWQWIRRNAGIGLGERTKTKLCWTPQAAGISFFKPQRRSRVTQGNRVICWLIVILCLPTFVALLVVLTSTMRPNMSVYLLIPLAFVAPSCLLGAVIMAIQVRRSTASTIPRHMCRAVACPRGGSRGDNDCREDAWYRFQRASAR